MSTEVGKCGENSVLLESLRERMIFTGMTSAKLDAKGRVFLPSDFRKQLEGADSRFVLKRDVFQPCLVVYPYSVWETEVDGLRQRLNRWNPREAMLFRQFMADVEVMELDSKGRFILPKRWLAVCHIADSVSFIGVDDRIEVWSTSLTEQPFLAPDDYALAMEEMMGKPLPEA